MASQLQAVPEHHGLDRRMVTFFGVMAAMFLAALDQTIVGTAAPRIVKELNGLDRLAWVTTAYLLTSTAIVPVIGKLSEQLGRKRVFLSGIVLFLLGSALSGLAQDMNQLILFRGFQGIGAGVLTGTAFAIIADLFSPVERGKYTGLFVSVFGLASILGPLIGGYLTDNVGWRAVFYVNLPIGAAVLVLLAITFPSMHFEGERERIDFLGAAGIGFGAASIVIGASLAAINDWAYPGVWIGLVIGVTLIVVTMFHEARTPSAVMPIALFKSSIFSLSMFVTFLIGGIMFGAILYLPLFLQAVAGVSATYSGLLLIPMMAGMMVAAAIGGFIISGTGRYKIQAILGFALMGAAMYMLMHLTVSSGQLEVARDMVMLGLGMGTSMPVFNVIAQNAVHHTVMSAATSAIQFTRQMGGTLGLAVLGSLFIQNYRAAVQVDVSPTVLHAMPVQIRGLIDNPQKFAEAIGRVVGGAAGPERVVLGQLVHGVKLALTTAVVDTFVVGFVLALVALFASLWIREIPLRKTSTMQDRAQARADALKEPVVVG
jgi:EmrB/QacA subfamily drug resistance transporter